MLKMRLLIWITLNMLARASAVPNELLSTEITDDYIDKFTRGLEDFRNSSYVVPCQENIFDPLKYDEHAAMKNAEEYDFIVIGSGAAGSVIANRLSEIPHWKILLLEAGETETQYTQVPGNAGAVLGSKYDWGYLTEPQDTWCLGMVGRKCTTPTGKGLGGGTVINGMVYTRGNPRDYDLWASQGNEGWSYKDVLPYFKKAENCALKDCNTIYHNHGGPLNVEETQYVSPLLDTFLSAGKELGYNIVDYNAKQQIGFSRSQATTKHGKRHSAAQAYLLPYKNRANLHIRQLSHVIQIIINVHSKTVIGVKYIQNDRMYIAKSDKEVIVSAGPFNSAQLLMLSGVGPKEDLEKLRIPVIKHLQVGRHLKDHVAFQGLNFGLNISKFEEGSIREQVATWLRYGKGPLAGAAGTGLAYIKTDSSKDDAQHPDVEIILGVARFSDRLRFKETYRSVLQPISNLETFRIDVMPARPKSTGTVKLRSKDPYHTPLIDPRQFSDIGGHDIETIVSGIKTVIKLTNTKAFQKLGAYLFTTTIKDCHDLGFGSDDYWKCAVRYLSIGVRHQTGACKMGPPSDKYAVVDNKLNVYGIRKLRVADSSVIPVSITGHTHAASNMVGEKAADLIKEYWK